MREMVLDFAFSSLSFENGQILASLSLQFCPHLFLFIPVSTVTLLPPHYLTFRQWQSFGGCFLVPQSCPLLPSRLRLRLYLGYWSALSHNSHKRALQGFLSPGYKFQESLPLKRLLCFLYHSVSEARFNRRTTKGLVGVAAEELLLFCNLAIYMIKGFHHMGV